MAFTRKPPRPPSDDDGGFETMALSAARGAGSPSEPAAEWSRSSERPPTRAAARAAARSAARAAEASSDASSEPVSEYTRSSETRKKKTATRQPPTLSLRARAIGFLSRREHSRLELERKLAAHAETPEAIPLLLDALEKEGWLSNERYALSLLHRRAPVRGTARIVAELRQSGVAETEIADLREGLRATEYARALEVWQKRFGGEAPADRAAYAKHARFLDSRGFAHDVIHRILGEAE
jgi:regulatory protein